MKIRLIIQSTENGESEYVQFTEEFDADISEFLFPDHTVNFDKVIDADIPDIFPKEYDLKRR